MRSEGKNTHGSTRRFRGPRLMAVRHTPRKGTPLPRWRTSRGDVAARRRRVQRSIERGEEQLAEGLREYEQGKGVDPVDAVVPDEAL